MWDGNDWTAWAWSPSTRREWIEIVNEFMGGNEFGVSLHTEGVD